MAKIGDNWQCPLPQMGQKGLLFYEKAHNCDKTRPAGEICTLNIFNLKFNLFLSNLQNAERYDNFVVELLFLVCTFFYRTKTNQPKYLVWTSRKKTLNKVEVLTNSAFLLIPIRTAPPVVSVLHMLQLQR